MLVGFATRLEENIRTRESQGGESTYWFTTISTMRYMPRSCKAELKFFKSSAEPKLELRELMFCAQYLYTSIGCVAITANDDTHP